MALEQGRQGETMAEACVKEWKRIMAAPGQPREVLAIYQRDVDDFTKAKTLRAALAEGEAEECSPS